MTSGGWDGCLLCDVWWKTFEAVSDTPGEKITKGRPDLLSVTDHVANDFVEKMVIPSDIADRPSSDKLLKYSHHALLSATYQLCVTLQHWHCDLC